VGSPRCGKLRLRGQLWPQRATFRSLVENCRGCNKRTWHFCNEIAFKKPGGGCVRPGPTGRGEAVGPPRCGEPSRRLQGAMPGPISDDESPPKLLLQGMVSTTPMYMLSVHSRWIIRTAEVGAEHGVERRPRCESAPDAYHERPCTWPWRWRRTFSPPRACRIGRALHDWDKIGDVDPVAAPRYERFKGGSTCPFSRTEFVLTALSFQYTSDTDVNVTVYDGPNMTGNVLGATPLSTAGLCSDDVCGVWRNVTVPFSGVAKSAGFSSDQFYILIVDDLVIDLAQPTKRPRKHPTRRPTKSPVCRTRRKGNMKRCTK
jgi:hypothetical protein